MRRQVTHPCHCPSLQVFNSTPVVDPPPHCYLILVARGPLRTLYLALATWCPGIAYTKPDNMRLHQLAFGLVACAPLTFAVPASPSNSLKSRVAASDCPGYEASNVVKSDSGLTADLTLAGDACNVYGTDLKDLKLVVEHQTSEYYPSPPAIL